MAAKSAAAQTPSRQPNIFVIVGDDVGMRNLSAYHRGMMGGPGQASGTFSIDRALQMLQAGASGGGH